MGAPEPDLVQAAIEANTPALLAYFARRASPEDAADMFGDALLVAWRRAEDLPANPGEARMWLFGVARRVAADHRRSRRRRSALRDKLVTELATGGAAPVDPVDERARAAVDQLRDLDREIIRLVYWDGFTLAETARLLERPEGTIRSRHHRARRQLRTHLERADAVGPTDTASVSQSH